MRDVDRLAFVEAFTRVQRMHGGRDWSREYIAELAVEYFDALSDLRLSELEAAAGELVRSASRWPRPIDWRKAVEQLQAKAQKPSAALPQVIDGEVTYCCANCQDTGWRPSCGCRMGEINWRGECESHPRMLGDRPYRQSMMVCACRELNPAYQAGRTRPVASRETRDAA